MFNLNKIQLLLIPIIFILFILLPFFETKLLFFLIFVVLIVNNVSTIKKAETWLFLGILFAFAFINTPYWQVFPDPKQKIFALLVLILVGGIWSYFSASEIAVKKNSLSIVPLVVLTSFILVVNYRPLIADIAWRGDESFHIYALNHLVNHIRGVLNSASAFHTIILPIYLGILLLFATYFFIIRAKRIPATLGRIIGVIFAAIIILFPAISLFYRDLPRAWNTDTLSLYNIIHWPFFEKWVNLLFLFPNFSYDIRLYRMLPLLCAILIAWYLFTKFNTKLNNHFLSVLFSLSFITTPLIYNFSTIVYLEMPIVLVLTYCMFNIQDLLYADTKTFVNKPVWYALLLLAFFKETVFIALIVLIVSRFVIQMAKYKFTVKRTLSELLIYILAIFPLLTYLFFRKYFGDERPYRPQLSILLDPRNYRIVLKALFDQMGALLPLSVAGLIVLFLNRKKTIFFVLLTLFMAVIIFFMMDGPLYLGYSRWNLLVIPIIFYLAYRFLTPAPRPILVICLIALIVGNYFLNPIMSDGVRISNWGSPNTDGAEYYYPYERAIHYLKSEKNIKSVLILGHYFPHWGIQFYQAKYNFYPRIFIHQFNGQQPVGVVWFDGRKFNTIDEQNYLTEFFSNCRKPGSETTAVDAIIYQSVNNINLNTNEMYCGKFSTVQRMKNSLNSLYILE